MPFRHNSALFGFFAALSLLSGTVAPGACAADTPPGNWVTTGSNVAATTFTQVLPSGTDALFFRLGDGDATAEETTDQTSAHFLRLFPQNSDALSTSCDGVTFGTISGYAPYFSSTLGQPSLPLGEGGVSPAVVPEPGPMVTVVVLGFMTGVALLRGQSRVSAARLVRH